jgi:Zn-finger nucleic acid-binding protein
MNCPRDGSPLEPVGGRAPGAHVCPQCGGELLELDRARGWGVSPRSLNPRSRKPLPVQRDLLALSPANGKPMVALRYRGVVIDYEAESNTVWFDPGELEKIAERKRKRTKPQGGWGDGIAGGIESGIIANTDNLFELASRAVAELFGGG